MKKRVVYSGVLVVIAGLALWYFALYKPAAQTGGQPIRIAFNTWIGYSSFYIAEQEGLFKKRGLRVETKVIDPLAEKNAAVLKGDLDGMGGTIDSAVISATSGLSGKVVMMFDRSNGTDGIIVTEDIKSIADLAKNNIAVEEGFVGHFFLLYVIDKAGLDIKSLKITPMTTDQAGTAFAAGKINAAVTWEPLLTTARSRPRSRVLVSSADVDPILADTLFLSEKFLKTRSSDAQALVEALLEANAFWKKSPEKYLAFVASQWKWKQEDIAGTLKTVQLYECTDQIRLFGRESPGDLYRFVAKATELWMKAGVTKSAPPPSDILDPSYVRQVCK